MIYRIALLLLLSGCTVTEQRRVMAPPPPTATMKPVCPHGVREEWCRPLVANEKGITNLGNQPNEE